MKKNKNISAFQRSGHLWMIILYGLVMLLILMAILFGGYVYKMATDTDARNQQLRSAEGFLTATIRSSDEAGAFEVATNAGPEGDVLRVFTEKGAYETDLYLYHGMLVQENKAAGGELSPEDATPLYAMSTFALEETDYSIKITTDQGTFTCTPRSEEWFHDE